MKSTHYKQILIIFVVFFMIQIITRLIFMSIIEKNSGSNMSGDLLILIRDSIAFAGFIVFLLYTGNLNWLDLVIDYKWFGTLLMISLFLLFAENYVLNHLVTMEPESLGVLKLHPVSQLINILVYAPVVEEILCRKVIFRELNSINYWIPLILSTLIFTALHFQFNPIIFFLIFFYGLILGICSIKTNSVINPILIHSTVNAVQLIITTMRQQA